MSAVVSTLRANSGMVWLSAREAELMRSLGRANHGRANEIIDRRPSRISCFPCPCRRDAVVHLHTRASEKRGSPELSAGRWASDLLKQSPDILQLDLLEVDLVLFDAKMTRASGNGFQECEESAMMAEKKKEANTYLVVQVLRLELNGAHVDEGMLGLALLLLYSVACSTSSTDRARSGRAATRLEEDEKKIWGGASGGWLLVSDWPNKPPGLHDSGGKRRTKVLSKRPAFFSASGAAFSVVAGPAAAGAATFSWVTSGCPVRVLAPTSGCAAGFCDGADMASVERVATGLSTRRRVSSRVGEREKRERGGEQARRPKTWARTAGGRTAVSVNLAFLDQ